ncbi:MAG: EamA family transporter [Verrucomicrobiota bacterium]
MTAATHRDMTTRPTPLPTSKLKHLSTWITLAFIYVYIAWGATYMAVHWALESLPPFLIAGSRFTLAGAVLLGIVAVFQRRQFHLGSVGEWRDASVIGVMLLVGGNGMVAWAQQYVNTSSTALIFGSIPLFIILVDWLRPAAWRPRCARAWGWRWALSACASWWFTRRRRRQRRTRAWKSGASWR